MATKLFKDFKEFLKLLNENRVKYLLIGGYAVNIHGYPRFTGDIDFWVSNDSDNAKRLHHSLLQFGFDDPDISPESFQKPNALFRMGVVPFRIEIHTSISGVEFEECYQQHELHDFDGVPVNVIDFNNLIKNKRASGRYKDLDDIENLEK